MKKVISFLLAVVLCFTLAAEAFAASVKLEAVSETVQTGQNIAVALTVDESYSDVITLETRLYYNSALFTYVSYTEDNKDVTVKATPSTDANGTYMQVTIISATGGAAVKANEKIATLVFAAKDGVTEQTSAEFKSKIQYGKTKDGTEISASDMQTYSVTITPPAPGYQVSVPKSISAGVNGETIVPVAVHLTEANGTYSASNTFNAYSFTVTYDTAMLRYKSITPTEAKVTELGNGKLKIAGTSHKAINGSDTAFKLTFETFAAVGAATVTVSDAKIDDKANAIDKDAPWAKAGNLTTTVTVGGYSVTLPEGFEGKGSAAAGEDYTFKVTDGKAYTVTATVDGISVPVTKNDDSYTIEGRYVTGKIVVKATPKKMVTVNVTHPDKTTIAGLNNGTTVPEGEDVTFTVTSPLDKNPIAYTVKVGEVEIAASRVAIAERKGPRMAYAYTYTIPGSMVKGESITVTVEQATDSVALIKTGNGWDENVTLTYTAGGVETTLTGGTIPTSATALTVTIKQNDKRNYTAVQYKQNLAAEWTDFGEPEKKDGNLVYTYTGGFNKDILSNGSFAVKIDYTEKADFAADKVVEYLKLGTDASAKTMWLVLCSGKTNGYLTCSYGENTAPMYYSEKYQAWAYLVISGDAAETVKQNVSIMNVDESAGKKTVDYSGDVNMTGGGVDINDAQLIVNMYNADYTKFTGNVTMEKFLRADMDGSKAVNNEDVLKIIAAVNS